MSAKNWVKFIFLGLIWGCSFLWIKIILREFGPFTLVFFRTLFASLGLVVYFIFSKRKFYKHSIIVSALLGLFNVAIPFVLISWAETRISSGLASILNATVPLFTMVIAASFVEDEKFTLTRVIGLLVGFFGVFVLSSNNLNNVPTGEIIGVAAMLLAAICYACSGVFARKTNHFVSPEEQSIGQMASGMIFVSPLMISLESPVHFPTQGATWVGVLWLGILGSCVSTLLWFQLIKDVGPSRTSMVTYMFPLVGVILGLLVLQETLDWRLFVGGAPLS